MNTDLNALSDWFKANKLSLNVSKTNHMLFTNADVGPETTNLILSDQTINQCSNAKFVGIYIDNKSKWDTHIKNTATKISRSLFAINKVKQMLPRHSLTSMYYTLSYPHLKKN